MSAPLRWLSGDSDCKNVQCPTLWGTDDDKDYVVQDYVVQGYVITDRERLAQLDLPEGQAAVMVPAAVLEEYLPALRTNRT